VCASYRTYEIEFFSLDLNTDSESLPILTKAGSDFQTAQRIEKMFREVSGSERLDEQWHSRRA